MKMKNVAFDFRGGCSEIKRATGSRSIALQRYPAPCRVSAVDNWPFPDIGTDSLPTMRLTRLVQKHNPGAESDKRG